MSEERCDQLQAIHEAWVNKPAYAISRGQLEDSKTILELLAALGALRAELDDARQTRLAIKLVRTEEERDALRAALEDIADHSGPPFNTIKWQNYIHEIAVNALDSEQR